MSTASGAPGASPEDLGKEPAETDFAETPGRLIKENWSQYDLKILTFKWGIYTIDDWGTSVQSESSEAQIDVEDGYHKYLDEFPLPKD